MRPTSVEFRFTGAEQFILRVDHLNPARAVWIEIGFPVQDDPLACLEFCSIYKKKKKNLTKKNKKNKKKKKKKNKKLIKKWP